MARAVSRHTFVRRARERKSYDSNRGWTENLSLTGRSESGYEFEVDMGEAALVESELALKLNSREVRGIRVSMGNPHYVVFVERVFRELAGRGGRDSTQF